MSRLLRALVTSFALLGAAAMVLAPLLVSAHQAHVQHVRCLEHGEVIELVQADSEHQDHHDPVVVPASPDDHDSHCSVAEGLASALTVQHRVHVVTTALVADAPVLLSAAPRGPPLAYAPKTSPPSCA